MTYPDLSQQRLQLGARPSLRRRVLVPALGLLVAALPLGAATVGNRVWLDLDGDGSQDFNESGLDHVTLELRCADGALCPRTTQTGGDGYYSFAGLPAGTYTVAVDTSGLNPDLVPSYDLDGVDTPHEATVDLSAYTGTTLYSVSLSWNPVTATMNHICPVTYLTLE